MKEVIVNFIKNTFAYALPVAVLQFVVQPYIANKLGEEQNGLYLTIIAVNYFITNITANILLQIRLLQNSKYEEARCKGDFNIILLIMIITNSIVMMVAVIFYMGSLVSVFDVITCIIISVLFLIHDYIGVEYRVNLDYNKILISNIILCFGYGIGILCYTLFSPHWQIIFIVAYFICEIYDFCKTTYWKEPLKWTIFFKDTTKRYLILAGSSLLTSIVTYGDRMLLYPFSSGSTVSIFATAGTIGKMIMLLSTPLSGFFLNYIVKTDKMRFNISKKIYLICILFLVLVYGTSIGMSIPFLYILYPEWASRSIQYVPFTTLSNLINLVSNILNIIVIRFCSLNVQLLINGTYLITYIIFSFTLFNISGLIGFCIGNILSVIAKLVLILIFINRVRLEHKRKGVC